MSREKAKLSYRWMPAVIQRWAVSRGRLLRDEETGEPFRVPCCPDCTAQIVDKDGVPLTDADLSRRKHTCAGCGSPLWQADKSGPARYPLADYVKHRMKGFFDLLVGDEVHEYKGRGAAQGIAAGVLADACGKSLSLSGTLMGGYSSTLFHLLYRFSPELRTDFGRSDEHRWIQRYGFEEHTVGKPDDDAVEDGRNSRRRKYRKVVRERPGLVPSALFHIIGNTVFLRLSDVASGLPPYDEQILLSSMDSEEDATGYSQRSAYNTVYEELRLKLAEALKAGSKRLLATYLQTLLAYPDGCTRGETVFDPRSGDVIVQAPPLSEERLYPKEKALIDLVAAERMEGRKALVYATHTGTRDITERMDDMLTRHGFRVAVMKADAVAPERREAWVADRVKQGIDVMICHPRLVQTGLDLIDFPTLIWYETDYSVYVMRQASRRSWRIGQTRPVKVVFMSYKNTLQADALKLVAKKLQSSLAVEGELPEDGLAAYGDDGDDGDDLMMALARKIVSGDEEEDETETVEAVFAQARDAEATAEEYLVDDDWKVVEVEPETVAVNGNGHHAGGIGPTVELVVGNGRHANGNGNGHSDETPEPQQSLFSWAEFMAEEPVKPKGRGGKAQAPPLSLFEWAVEQEREEEPVGAGRLAATHRVGHRDSVSHPARLCMRAFLLPFFRPRIEFFPCLPYSNEGETHAGLGPSPLTSAEDHRRAQKREHAPYCRTASDRALKRVRHISDSSTRDEWTVCWSPYEQLRGPSCRERRRWHGSRRSPVQKPNVARRPSWGTSTMRGCG